LGREQAEFQGRNEVEEKFASAAPCGDASRQGAERPPEGGLAAIVLLGLA